MQIGTDIFELLFQSLGRPPSNGAALQSAAAHLHPQEQRSRASPTTAESPYACPPRQHSPPHPLSRPLANSSQGGQADEPYAEDAQNGTNPAGQEPTTALNEQVSNLDGRIWN